MYIVLVVTRTYGAVRSARVAFPFRSARNVRQAAPTGTVAAHQRQSRRTTARAVRDGCCATLSRPPNRPGDLAVLGQPTDQLLVYRIACPARRGQEFGIGITKSAKVGPCSCRTST